MQAIKGIHIIENLSNSLNHRVGALKRDGVKAQQMVCSVAVSKNIKSGKTVTKMLGVNKQFLYKMMKKRGRLLSLSMLLWGNKKQLPQLDSLSVSVRKLVQGWWTLETTISPNKKDVIRLNKGVKKYITPPTLPPGILGSFGLSSLEFVVIFCA
jgi:hypothetical protein